ARNWKVTDMDERTEFGYRRTSCACHNCRLNCEVMPGFLIPADLGRMIPKECGKCRRPMKGTTTWDGACDCGGLIRNVDEYIWAEQNLLASPGALVISEGKFRRIPTLVPATKEDGSCIHLTSEGNCDIHAVAPFGCAFFDCGEEPEGLAHTALHAVMMEWGNTFSLYRALWIHLAYKEKLQLPAEDLRAIMRD